jgi:Ca2+-transporting ATPase
MRIAPALVQVFHTFNARSQVGSAFTAKLFTNGWLWAAVAVCLLLQVAAVHIPFLQTVLHTTSLTATDRGVVLGFSVIPIAVVELVKLLRRALAA